MLYNKGSVVVDDIGVVAMAHKGNLFLQQNVRYGDTINIVNLNT